MLQLTVLLFILLLHLSPPLFLFPGLLKLTLLFSYLPLLILTTPLSIFLILLVLFLRQVPWCYLEFLPSFLTLDPHFLTLFPCLLNPCLPWSLPELYLFPSLLLDLSPALGLDLLGGQSGIPGVPFLGERAPRGRRSKITSTASCQTSPIPSYFWPDFQPSRVSSGGSSTDSALDLALMPRAYNHFPISLPLDPLHFDFFTILRAASPVVTFHCPSPLTQKSFSFVYSLHFPRGQDSKPLLVAGIHQ